MTRRRDRAEMTVDILETCMGGAKLTKILRLANLHYNAFGKFVDPLVERGYLLETPVDTRDQRTLWEWETTPEGRKFQREIKDIYRRLTRRTRK